MTSISLNQGHSQQNITLTGTGFAGSSCKTSNDIKIGDYSCAVLDSTETSVKCKLDMGASTTSPMTVYILLLIFLFTWILMSGELLLYPSVFVKVCRQSRKTFLLLCCLFFLVYFFSFISFPLSAFCDFSAICHQISLIFGQTVDNNL